MAGQVDEVKDKTDIVSVIGEYVDLKRSGSNYKGLCPFHSEKSPSFMVSAELQIFKCFGCSKGGDVITFLQEYEGMEFYEALEFLAKKAGVKLAPIQGKKFSRKEELYKVNYLVQKFYIYILHNHSSGKHVLEYLKKDRGLKLETVKEFGIGFSPDVPFALKKYAERKGININDLEQAGIVYSKNGRAFDRFRGRIVFPLLDHRGNTAGFAGRILPGKDNIAKYINTPETPVYHKSNMLFGLYNVRRDIKKQDQAIITEGELDMISAWQVGIKNTVALKGSAFTSEQVKLLSRYTKNIILALDADLAGDAAAKRGIQLAQSQGFEIKVATLVGYKDPDDAAREDPDSLKKAIKNAKNVWDFLIDSIFDKYDVSKGSDKAKISKEVVPVLTSIEDGIVQAHYIDLVARRLSVPVEAVSNRVSGSSDRFLKNDADEVVVLEDKKIKSRRELMEEHLLTAAFRSDPIKLLVHQKLLRTPFASRLVAKLEEYLKEDDYDLKNFSHKLPEELKISFSMMVLKEFQGADPNKPEIWEKEFKALIYEIKLSDVKSDLEKITETIKEYEKAGHKEKLKEAEKKHKKLTKLRTELEGINYKSIIQI